MTETTRERKTLQRPCLRRHPRPVPVACRPCWLYEHDARYRALWGGDPGGVRPAPPPRPPLPCRFEGPVIEWAQCRGREDLHVRDCELHERCTRGDNDGSAASCAACPDYAPAWPDLPLRRALELTAAPPGAHGEVWYASAECAAAHNVALAHAAASAPAYPGGHAGRGVVTGAGGALFFGCALAALRALRRHGCTLPVEWWHLGRGEMDPEMTAAALALGVRVVDARAVAAALPDPPRVLNGWELKAFAVAHSDFAEVMCLDADCVPYRDPTPLFDAPQYLRHGAAFWPDLPPHNRPEWLPAVCWQNCGMAYRDEPDFESGQFVIDKRRCWRELSVTMWLGSHSDYVYRFVYGDKSTFHLAWRRCGSDYAMPDTPAGWAHPCILQYDFVGRLAFLHHCQGKAQMAEAWGRPVWGWAAMSDAERALAARLEGRRWHYRRAGVGERPLELLPGGGVGEGRAACEQRWSLRVLGGVPTLVIVGGAHKGSEVGMMFLTEGPGGVWRGGWEYHERNAAELAPAWTCRPGTWDQDILDAVHRDNEYGLPGSFAPGSVVLDVGAHTGSFCRACLERGAARVVAVEPEPGNAALLRHNLAAWGGRVEVVEAAAWPGPGPLRFTPCAEPANTGGGGVLDPAGPVPVAAVGLDDLIRAAGPVRLLKLDCEGAEFACLDACTLLGDVEELVGEYHEHGGRTAATLAATLEGRGFSVTVRPTAGGLGHFRAARKAVP